MDTEKSKLFMRMVLNPDLNCKSMEFSFETVFYRTSYSYCCCPCAYQHEYFDYLSDKDEMDEQKERHIDEAMFERIVQNIADRRCPHADIVESKYLTTSTVYTDHILAVSGSRKDFKRASFWYPYELSSIFKLHSFVNLVSKNSCHLSDFIENFGTLQFFKVSEIKKMYPIRTKDNHEIVHWEKLSLFEYSARKGNKNVFQRLLMSPRTDSWECPDISAVYDLAFKYQMKEMLKSLIENSFKIYVHHESSKYCENINLEKLIGAEAAIVYNQPEILDCLIPRLARKTDWMEKARLVFICVALNRDRCRKVLLKYGFPKHDRLFSDLHQQNALFHILLNYSCHSEEIISIIRGYKKIKLPSTSDRWYYQHILQSDCFEKQPCLTEINSIKFIQLLTFIGEDIDLTGLQIGLLDGVYRELVELCLFSNLSNLNSLAEKTVDMYLKHYHKTGLKTEGLEIFGRPDMDLIFQESHVPSRIGRDYIMDAKEHFLFSEENFALNFILPLFIECGFPLRRNLIDTILHNEEVSEKLHPAETEYLINSLEQPRSLQLCCRDSLRRHFKNRQIHQFVSISNVPNKIKDFILLKTVLPTLKYTGFKQDDECSKDTLEVALKSTPEAQVVKKII